MTESTHQTKVLAIGREVFISLPDDAYIKMTPDQARQIGGRLFIAAAEALGEPVPAIIALEVNP